MTARELLGEYNRLYDENPQKAKDFAEDNKNNKLFYSVILLLEQIVPALCAQKDFMINGVEAAMAEDDSIIQEALMEHVKVETSARVLDQLKKDLIKE